MPIKKTAVIKKDRAEKSSEKFRNAFPELSAPEKTPPKLGVKISHIKSDQLGDLLAQFSAWREYAEDMHITALSEFMAAKDAYDLAISKNMVASDASDVTTKRAMAETDPNVSLLGQKYLDTEIYLKMVAHKLESYGNSLTMLSRELTRRGMINV